MRANFSVENYRPARRIKPLLILWELASRLKAAPPFQNEAADLGSATGDRLQYFGTFGSTRSDQAVIPPARL